MEGGQERKKTAKGEKRNDNQKNVIEWNNSVEKKEKKEKKRTINKPKIAMALVGQHVSEKN